jgi:hypothetical protein
LVGVSKVIYKMHFYCQLGRIWYEFFNYRSHLITRIVFFSLSRA